MKFISTFIFSLFIALSCFGQTPRSEIISDVSIIKVKGDRLERIDSTIIQINERMGDRDAEISIPYSKGDKPSIGDAWIEDLNGNVIRKLKKNEITDRSHISGFSLYEDDFIKTFNLKHNRYPYRVIYSYKIIYSKFIKITSFNYNNVPTPVKSAKLIVEVPAEMQIKYRQENVSPPEISTITNMNRYTWNYSYMPEGVSEINSSPNSSNAPKIEVVPVNFKYGKEGSFDNWKSFGNWMYRLNKGRDQLTMPEQNKINKLISGIDDDKQKIKILYQYLQDYTRYINVSIKIGGLQTYPASYVCDNKYGDCKALTNYMQSMLKYVGIKSYFTLIHSSKRVLDIDESFTTDPFNHVILSIPFEKDTMYIECTSKNTTLGYIHTSIQGRKALVIEENNSHLVSVPALKAEDVLCIRNFIVNLNTSEINLEVTEKGENYEFSTFLSSDYTKNTIDKYIRNNILSGSFDLLDFKFDKENRDSAVIKMSVNCKMHHLSKEYANNIILNSFPLILPTYELPEKRVTDVQIDYPEYYKDNIVYELREKNISKIPEDINIKSEYGEYSQSFKQDGNKLIVNKSVLIRSGRYTKDQYKKFYEFMNSVKNNENKNYYLEVL